MLLRLSSRTFDKDSIMTRNTMDEDWDERRDGGKDVPEYGC